MENGKPRIVITGIGLTAPNGNNLTEYRENLLNGKSGIDWFTTKLIPKVIAGVCDFDQYRYQNKKMRKRGTRAGSTSIYCANEAILDSKIDMEKIDKDKIGIYVGITDHGGDEVEDELFKIKEFDYDVKYWSHHTSHKMIANNAAGEVALNLGITGSHYTIGAACAAGNIGLVHGVQMLTLGEVDMAFAGGISEAAHVATYFAGFQSQNALGSHNDPGKACRPFDKSRNGIVISEGGCIFVLEKLDAAVERNAHIYAEVVGYGINTDATDHVIPNSERQAQCMKMALDKACIEPDDIDLINTHATSTPLGDKTEARSVNAVFADCDNVYINNTKSFIGHSMGAAGALELAGNLSSFDDGYIHHILNLEELDPECEMKNVVMEKPLKHDNVRYILNNSFGMLGINSTVIVKKYEGH